MSKAPIAEDLFRLQHAQRLAVMFPRASEWLQNCPISTLKRIESLEREAHRLMENVCNYPMDVEYVKRQEVSILTRLDSILGFKEAGIPVFINDNPRGYALKIQDEYVRAKSLRIETDLGGCGIISPDFN